MHPYRLMLTMHASAMLTGLRIRSDPMRCPRARSGPCGTKDLSLTEETHATMPTVDVDQEVSRALS